MDRKFKPLKNDVRTPEIVSDKVEAALDEIRKETDEMGKNKKSERRYLHFFRSQIAAAACVAVVAGVGVTAVAAGVNHWSGGVLQVLKATPEEQQNLVDKGMAVTGDDKKLSELAVTDNGVTVVPVTVVADDRSAHVAFRVKGLDSTEKLFFGSTEVYLSSDSGGENEDLSTDEGFRDTDTADPEADEKVKNAGAEYVVNVLPQNETSLAEKTLHIDLKNLEEFNDDTVPDIKVKGSWKFTIKLPQTSSNQTFAVHEKIKGSDFTVDRVDLSPISIKIAYSSEVKHTPKLKGTDKENEAPTVDGLILKDGTVYKGITNGGMSGYENKAGTKAEDNFSLDRVIDPDKVSALLIYVPGTGKTVKVPIR